MHHNMNRCILCRFSGLVTFFASWLYEQEQLYIAIFLNCHLVACDKQPNDNYSKRFACTYVLIYCFLQ